MMSKKKFYLYCATKGQTHDDKTWGNSSHFLMKAFIFASVVATFCTLVQTS